MRRLLVGIGLLALLAPGASAQQPGAKAVVASELDEEYPVARNGYLAWAQAPKLRDPTDVIVRPPHGTPFRVNPRGTAGIPGSIDGHVLVYTQTKDRGKVSRIVFYDLRSRHELRTPRGVNLRGWNESSPSLSGNRLVFVRTRGEGSAPPTYQYNLVLLDLKTGAKRRLGFNRGVIAGDYLAYTSGPGEIENLRTGARDSLRGFVTSYNHSISVTHTGTVYRDWTDHKSQIEVHRFRGATSDIDLNQWVAGAYADDSAKPTRIYYTVMKKVGNTASGDIWVMTDPTS